MNVRPVVYDTSGKQHTPAPAGAKLDADLINTSALVSMEANNALQQKPDGTLYVDGTPPHVSLQTGNFIRYGNDHGVYLDGNDILSNSEVNLLDIADGDKKIALTPAVVTDVVVNATKADPDMKDALHASVADAVRNSTVAKDAVEDAVFDALRSNTDVQDAVGDVVADSIAHDADVQRALGSAIDMGVLDALNGSADVQKVVNELVTEQIKNDTGLKDAVSDLVTDAINDDTALKDAVTESVMDAIQNDPTTKEELQNAVTVVSSDTGNALVSGRDKGAFLAVASLISAAVENALKLDVAGKLMVEPTGADVLLVPNDPLLSAAGKNIISTIGVDFDELTGKLSLTGTGGKLISQTLIPASVELLESAQLVENPIGQPAGTYIHWVFKLTDDRKQDVFLNVNKLADVYTGGNGINVSSTGEITPVLYPGGGLGVDATGLYVATADLLSADPGNTIIRGKDNKLFSTGQAYTGSTSVNVGADNALSVILSPDGGLEAKADGLAVTPSNVLSDDAGNALKTGADGKLYLSSDDVAGGVSVDPGNVLIAGSDGRAYLPSDYGTMP